MFVIFQNQTDEFTFSSDILLGAFEKYSDGTTALLDISTQFPQCDFWMTGMEMEKICANS